MGCNQSSQQATVQGGSSRISSKENISEIKLTRNGENIKFYLSIAARGSTSISCDQLSRLECRSCTTYVVPLPLPNFRSYMSLLLLCHLPASLSNFFYYSFMLYDYRCLFSSMNTYASKESTTLAPQVQILQTTALTAMASVRRKMQAKICLHNIF